MILKTQVEMLASIERAIDTNASRNRAFHIHTVFTTPFYHFKNSEKQTMLKNAVMGVNAIIQT